MYPEEFIIGIFRVHCGSVIAMLGGLNDILIVLNYNTVFNFLY